MISYAQFVEKTNLEPNELRPGDLVVDTNPECKHYGAAGVVKKVHKIKQGKNIVGNKVEFKCKNQGKNWHKGASLQKTEIQLQKTS